MRSGSVNVDRSTKFCIIRPREEKPVSIAKNGKHKTFLVHRLVAENFLSNPNNLPCVNHKDENKENNYYTNLEWCSKQYNNTYGTRIEKAKQKLFVKVQKFTLDNTFIEEYNSIDEAGNSSNISPCNISNTLKGKQKTAGGFIWKYN